MDVFRLFGFSGGALRASRLHARRWSLRVVWGAAFPVLMVGWAHGADLPLTRLDSLVPAGTKPGAEVEVTLTGVDLDGVEGAWFSHPGLSARLVKEKVFAVRAEAGVPEGVYDMRIFGTHGVSNARAFVVDRLVTVPKAGECSLTKPMDLPVGTAVQGVSVAGGRDYYRFQAKKDQRLTVRCQTREVDSRMIPVFAVLEEGGRKLAGNERRPFLEFRAPKDGAYLVSVQDLAYGAGPDLYYRLCVDESPVIESAVPSALEAGKRTRVTLLGRGLPGSKPSALKAAEGAVLEALDVEIEAPAQPAPPSADGALAAAAVSVPTFSYRLRTGSGVSNAVDFVVLGVAPVRGTDLLQAPAAGAKPAPVALSFPGAGSGLYGKGFEGSPFEFEAKKGEVVVAEVYSQRLGFGATNSYLRLTKNGAHLAEAYGPDANVGGLRLSTLHNDPSLRFEVKEDGRYTLYLTDLSGAARPGVGAAYTLSVRKEEPGFALLAVTEPPPETANDRALQPRGSVLRAGAVVPVRVVAVRSGGFGQEIELSATGLPAGVSCEPTRILAGKTEGYLLLRGAPELAKAVASIRIEGKSADGKLKTSARAAQSRWVVTDFNTVPGEARLARGDGFPLGTTAGSVPLTLLPEAPAPLEAAPNAKLEVVLKVKRSADFKDAFKVKAGGFPGAETVKELDVDAKADTFKVPLDLAALKLAPGNHTAYFTSLFKTKVSGRDVTTTSFSAPVQIVVRAPGAKPAADAAKPEAKPEPGKEPK